MNILLHACCGPCSLEPVRLLRERGEQVTLAYCNPNIHPADEYERRRETLVHWADGERLDVLEFAYDPDVWESEVGRHGTDRVARCRACYRLRFERVARRAAELGFDAISTTLSVSPYQFTEVISDELEQAAVKVGVRAVFEDFRPYYREATRRSRELGMYRQRYCGCRLSLAEAEADRAACKAARQAAKRARREARDAAERYCSVMEAVSRSYDPLSHVAAEATRGIVGDGGGERAD
jgi:predicted adenine nucleotide alpha hydrolase (AANH) superfamily ATPase